jgi:hypothetical protein
MIDRRERFESEEAAMRAVLDGFQSSIWTALPGIIQSFDATKMTCEVQPAVQGRVLSKDDSQPLPGAVFDSDQWWWVNLPLLQDVPVVFQGGGGYTSTFPIAAGDECLVVFSSLCIDTWWQSGGFKNTRPDLRMHDLSDGFAIVGLRSIPRVLAPNVDLTGPQLRKDDGSVSIGISGSDVKITTTGGKVQINASSEVDVTAPSIKLGNGGSLQKLLNENFLAWATAHTHTSAAPGVQTSPPTVVPLAFPTQPVETAVVKAE